MIEAVLFGLFTCCMMLDQWTVVSTNTTSKCIHLSCFILLFSCNLSHHHLTLVSFSHSGIDRLKGEYHSIRGDVNEVFGGKDGRFRVDWFVPTPAQFPGSLASDIFGYRKTQDGDEDDDNQGIMMMERRSIDTMASGVAGGRPGSSPMVSRERLDGNWSVERVAVGDWQDGGGNGGVAGGEAIVEEAEDDRSKLLRTGIGV